MPKGSWPLIIPPLQWDISFNTQADEAKLLHQNNANVVLITFDWQCWPHRFIISMIYVVYPSMHWTFPHCIVQALVLHNPRKRQMCGLTTQTCNGFFSDWGRLVVSCFYAVNTQHTAYLLFSWLHTGIKSYYTERHGCGYKSLLLYYVVSTGPANSQGVFASLRSWMKRQHSLFVPSRKIPMMKDMFLGFFFGFQGGPWLCQGW